MRTGGRVDARRMRIADAVTHTRTDAAPEEVRCAVPLHATPATHGPVVPSAQTPLEDVLSGAVDGQLLAMLARHDVYSVEDVDMLTHDDFCEMDLTIGMRNRLKRTCTQAREAMSSVRISAAADATVGGVHTAVRTRQGALGRAAHTHSSMTGCSRRLTTACTVCVHRHGGRRAQ